MADHHDSAGREHRAASGTDRGGRCLKLGNALRKAIESYDEDLKVVDLGTADMSHQLQGERAGLIDVDFDLECMDRIAERSGVVHAVQQRRDHPAHRHRRHRDDHVAGDARRLAGGREDRAWRARRCWARASPGAGKLVFECEPIAFLPGTGGD